MRPVTLWNDWTSYPRNELAQEAALFLAHHDGSSAASRALQRAWKQTLALASHELKAGRAKQGHPGEPMTQDPTRRHVLTVWIGAVVVTILATWMSDRIAGREWSTQGVTQCVRHETEAWPQRVTSTPRSTSRLTGG